MVLNGEEEEGILDPARLPCSGVRREEGPQHAIEHAKPANHELHKL